MTKKSTLRNVDESLKLKKKKMKEEESVKEECQRRNEKDKKKKRDKKAKGIKEEKIESGHVESLSIVNDHNFAFKMDVEDDVEDGRVPHGDNINEDFGGEDNEMCGEDMVDENYSEDGTNQEETYTEDTPEMINFQTSIQKERLEKRKQKRKAKREKLKALVKKKAEPKTSKNTKTEGLLWKKFKEVAKETEGTLDSDTEEKSEKIVCENIEDEPDPVKKAIRLKKSEKRKKKKLEKWLKRKMYKERAGTAGPAAIRYLHYWETNREEWRFMKVRHVWLMKYMFNCEMIDNDDFELILRYLEPANGKTKNSLVQEAEEIIANIENEVEEKSEEDQVTVPSHLAEVLDRARQVIQTLAV